MDKPKIGIYCSQSENDDLFLSFERVLKKEYIVSRVQPDEEITSGSNDIEHLKLLISAPCNLTEIFSPVLRRIRYKRFKTYPVLFISSEHEKALRKLSRDCFQGEGFECVGCRGSFHLKAPFRLDEFKEEIQAAINKGIKDDELDSLLHCHQKCVLGLRHPRGSEARREIPTQEITGIIKKVLVIDDEADEWCEILKRNPKITFEPYRIDNETKFHEFMQELKKKRATVAVGGKEISSYDMVFLDLYFNFGQLRSDDKTHGEIILEEFEERRKRFFYVPPVVILTGLYDLEKAVGLTTERGAFGYLYKPHLRKLDEKIGSWSEKIEEEIGLARFIKKSEFKAAVMSVKKLCEQEQERFWYGDKVAAMVDHSKAHTMDVWRNLYEWLKESHLLKESNAEHLSDEELYVLLMAVLLHDIGHKGDGKDVDPVVLRTKHGIVSDTLIRESFRREPNPYGFKILGEIPAEAWAKAVGLICKYHRGQAPLTGKQQKEWEKEKEFYDPVTFYQFFKRKNLREAWDELGKEEAWEDMEEIGEKNECIAVFKNSKITERPELLAALLMFADATDIHKNRVKSREIRDARKEVLERDGEVYVQKFREKKELIFSKLEQIPGISSHNFRLAKEKFEKLFKRGKGGKEIEENFKNWSPEWEADAEQWYQELQSIVPIYDQELLMLIKYIAFLKGQHEHYDKHLAVENVDFKPLRSDEGGKYRFKVIYTLKRDNIKEAGNTDKPVEERIEEIKEQIIGDIQKEWERCGEVLKCKGGFSDWNAKESGVAFNESGN